MTRLLVNGIHLNVEDSASGPALLLLHGFTGSVATWEPLLAGLAGFRTVRVDLIGHGASDAPADPARYGIEACFADLTAVLDRLGISRTALLGYSLGGRIALQYALARPERIAALVLESAAPGIEDAADRELRVAADEELARFIEAEGIEAFVDRWQALPLWASQASLPDARRAALRRQRLQNSVLGLANSLRGMGAGRQPWLLPRLSGFEQPVLLIAGDLDSKYSELMSRMAAALPNVETRVVPAAGHAVHLEDPGAFAAAVLPFLNRHAVAKEAVR
jgi:2-succinyl-6-hydroxy-2,4-cyclohexadiene-1-carboxylate synthase